MKKLLSYLNILENTEELKPSTYISSSVNDDLKILLINIKNRASQLLVRASGMPIIENIKCLEESGYKVFPGDKDLDKWITGCLKTSKGTIVFKGEKKYGF